MLDDERVEEEKGAKDGVDFISTNDILVSRFGQVAQAGLTSVILNCRGKCNKIGDLDAGNYHTSLILTKENIRTPSMVRKIMNSGPPHSEQYKRLSTAPGPTNWEIMFSKNAVVTNWNFSFFEQF